MHRGAGNPGFGQVVLNALAVAVGGVAHRLFHRHLEDQMHPALQV